jgi:hypothetical protein
LDPLEDSYFNTSYWAPEVAVLERYGRKKLRNFIETKAKMLQEKDEPINANNQSDPLQEFPIDWKKADMWSVGKSFK